MTVRTDYTGQRFGRLVVIARSEEKNHRGRTVWRCVCDCGGEKACEGQHLVRGSIASCGCLADESRHRRPSPNRKHGLTHTTMWTIWKDMVRRCYDETDPAFSHYGGRGITVCERWRHDVAAFAGDMGARPPGMMIERVDNDRGYELGNCIWADAITQQNNRRNNHRITHAGRTLTVAQWAREVGMQASTLIKRIEGGWPFERAISQPVRPRRSSEEVRRGTT